MVLRSDQDLRNDESGTTELIQTRGVYGLVLWIVN